MRIAELLRLELERARAAIPGPWTICVSVQVHRELATELEVPYLDSLHGEHLVVARVDDSDLVVLMPATRIHIFSAEEAVALAGLPTASNKVRVVYVPPAGLTAAQVELYQGLRSDGVEPVLAAQIAAVV